MERKKKEEEKIFVFTVSASLVFHLNALTRVQGI